MSLSNLYKPRQRTAPAPREPEPQRTGPEVIVSLVRDITAAGHRFRLWDDPLDRWIRTSDELAAAVVQDAFAMETKLSVTVEKTVAVKVERA